MKQKQSYSINFFDENFTYSLYYKTVLKYKTLKRAFDKINKLNIDNLYLFEVAEFDVDDNIYHSKLTGRVFKYRDLKLYFKIKNLKNKNYEISNCKN